MRRFAPASGRRRDSDDRDPCKPTGDEWRICAAFIESDYTAYSPPEVHAVCEDDDCTYEWR